MSSVKRPVRVMNTKGLYKIVTNTGAHCVYRLKITPNSAGQVRREGEHVATQCVGRTWILYFDGEWIEKISAIDKRTLDKLDVFGRIGVES